MTPSVVDRSTFQLPLGDQRASVSTIGGNDLRDTLPADLHAQRAEGDLHSDLENRDQEDREEALLDNQPAEAEGGRSQTSEDRGSQQEELRNPLSDRSLPSPSHLIRAVCTDKPDVNRDHVKEELGDEEYSGEWSREERSVGEALLDHAAQKPPAEAGGRSQTSEDRGSQKEELHNPLSDRSLPSPSNLIRAVCTDKPDVNRDDVKEELGDEEYSGEWSREERSVGEALLDHAAQKPPAEAGGRSQTSGDRGGQQDAHSDGVKEELGDEEYSGEWSGEERSVGEALLDHAERNPPAEAGGRSQTSEDRGGQQDPHSDGVKEELGDEEYSGEWSGEERSVGEALLDHAERNPPAESGGRSQTSEDRGGQQDPHSDGVKEELGDEEYSGEWSGEERSVGEALLDHAERNPPAESGGRSQTTEDRGGQQDPHSAAQNPPAESGRSQTSEDRGDGVKEELGDEEYSGEWSGEERSVGEALLDHAERNSPPEAEGRSQTSEDRGSQQEELCNPLSDRSLPSPSNSIRAVCTDKPDVSRDDVSDASATEKAESGDNSNHLAEESQEGVGIPGIPANEQSNASMASVPIDVDSRVRDPNLSGDCSDEFEEEREENKLTFSVAVVDVDRKEDENTESQHAPRSPSGFSEKSPMDDHHLSVSEAMPSMTSASPQSLSGDDPFLENLDRNQPIHEESPFREEHFDHVKEELGDEEYSGEWSGEERSVGEALLDHAAHNPPAEAGGRSQTSEDRGGQQDPHSDGVKEELGDEEYSGEWSGEERSVGEALLDHAERNPPAEAEGERSQTSEDRGSQQEELRNPLSDRSLPSPSNSIRAVCTDKPDVNRDDVSDAIASEKAESGDNSNHLAEESQEGVGIPGIPANEQSNASMASVPMDVDSPVRDPNLSGDRSDEFEEEREENKLTFSVAVVDVDRKEDENTESQHAPRSPSGFSEKSPMDDHHLSVSEAMPSMTSASMIQSLSGDDPFLEQLERPKAPEEEDLGDGEYSGEWSEEESQSGAVPHALEEDECSGEWSLPGWLFVISNLFLVSLVILYGFLMFFERLSIYNASYSIYIYRVNYNLAIQIYIISHWRFKPPSHLAPFTVLDRVICFKSVD